MGFTEPTEFFQVTFVDYPGLEITTRDMSIKEMNEMMIPSSAEALKNTKVLDEMINRFIAKVVTWNLQHRKVDEDRRAEDGSCVACGLSEGDLLPTTAENFKCCSVKFMIGVTRDWMISISGVSADLKKLLGNGGENVELLMKQLATAQSPLS